MSRRKAAPKRQILPDPLFGNERLAKFMNTVMRSGKKSVAERIVYRALNEVMRRQSKRKEADIRTSEEARTMAMEAFEKAIENVTPMVEVRSRRVGGSTYQVPVEIRPARRLALAMRWLSEYAKGRGEKGMVLRLAGEIIDAGENRGGAVKKRDDVHRMAKANQAFAHYRW